MTISYNSPPTVDLCHLGGAPNSLAFICVPHAGGSIAVFRSWPKLLPYVDFYALSLPGRDARFDQRPFTNLYSLVASAVDAMFHLTRRPFALFGHSMGALIVFEIARLLRRKNAAAPAQLFISGFRAPHLPDLKSPRFDLPDERFIEELKRMNSPGCDSTAHSELLGLMLPTLRADFYLIETYRYDPEPSLACPITVYGGSYDAEVSEQQLREWRQHTSANFAMIMLPGGHFFPQTHTQVLLHEIDRQLSEQVTSRGHARKVDASSITKFPHATE